MDLNRNQWFLLGLVVLFLGIEFRLIDSIVLTPEVTKFIAERTERPVAAAGHTVGTMLRAEAVPPKTVRLPEWLGWALVSVGAVAILHALSMKAPGGG
jgi:hypothetical protein